MANLARETGLEVAMIVRTDSHARIYATMDNCAARTLAQHGGELKEQALPSPHRQLIHRGLPATPVM
jgi:hypothetical protein